MTKIHEIIRWTPERQRKIDEWQRQQALFQAVKKKPGLKVVKKYEEEREE